MGKVKLFNLFFWLVILFNSCQTEDSIPQLFPRLGMANLEDFSQEGMLFSAEIYDFGTEPILEYGFVYSNKGILDKENSDRVFRLGTPENTFEIFVNHSLTKGSAYKISAYIVTERYTVYSEPVDFSSQESFHFIFNELVVPNVLFFGDTIEFRGEKISQNLENVKVKVNDQTAYVFDLTDKSFKFKIPDNISVTQDELGDTFFLFDFIIAGKNLQLRQKVAFKKPEFNSGTGLVKVKPGATAFIKGKYLNESKPKVRYLGEGGSTIEMEVNQSGGFDQLGFIPILKANDQKPSFEVFIRGRWYIVPDFMEFLPATIDPNQTFQVYSGQKIEIKGNNFMPGVENNFWSTIPYIPDSPYTQVFVEEVGSTKLVLSVWFDENTGFDELKFFANNFGIQSENYAFIKLIK